MKSFLMLGQSNMAGRGDFNEVPEITNPLCKMLRNGKFIQMSEPINVDRAIFNTNFHSGVGLSASFADEYAKFFNEEIGLIPCADGGTTISEWQPNEVIFDNAIFQSNLAQRSSEIAGILWHQGENDSVSMDNVQQYHDKFLNTMYTLFEKLNLPKTTPIIIGELGEFIGKYRNGVLGYYKEINQVLENLSKELPCSAFVSAKGLTCKADGLHFDSKSCREFGKRYFEAYLKAIKK